MAKALRLHRLLEASLPAVHMFAMTPANLNKAQMIPVKDYDVNRLRAGMLQVRGRPVFAAMACAAISDRNMLTTDPGVCGCALSSRTAQS